MSSEQEDAYFRQRELERREDMRRQMERAAKELQDARGVARSTGIADLELAERIRKLGFSGETAAIFDLLPLILTAWADGSVSRAERETIFAVLNHRGIARDSEPFLAVEALLEKQPTQPFIDESMDVLRELMAQRPDAKSAEVIELCAAVADASGGILGLVKRVSAEERALLEKIADRLGSAAQEQFRRSL
jgi:tellurite resistance protein